MAYDQATRNCILTRQEVDQELSDDSAYGGMFLHRGGVVRTGLLGKWWTWECACGVSGSRFVNIRSAREALERHLYWVGINRKRRS